MKIQNHNKIKKVKSFLTNLPTNKLTTSRGFSFIELIVAVAIMAIITSAVLFKQARFSSDILITNMTYEIALAIRQAQVYGISSKQSPLEVDVSGGSTLGEYKVGYGVHFEPTVDGGKPNTYMNFVDIPTSFAEIGLDAQFNYFYNGESEYIPNSNSTLSQGKIRQYCASNDGSNWNCGPVSGTSLDIVFVKPNPDAHITLTEGGTHTQYTQAKIVVESALGDKCRTVTVYGSGQISVDSIDSTDTNNGCTELE